MKFEDRAPEIEEVKVAQAPGAPAVMVVDLQPFAADIAGAIDAAGPEQTAEALALVQAGAASPAALLAWIDELRDPESHAPDTDPAEQQQGFVPDFLIDTCFASGAIDTPPRAGNDAIEALAAGPDDDYFFSAVRRRRLEEERILPLELDPELAPDEDKERSGS